MDNILPENEYTEFEGRRYLNPQTSLNETNTFIDNLRANQGTQNNQIYQQTRNLGTEVPSNIGGLTGANSYFTSRYQTPQTNAVVNNLRSTAQAKALNDVLSNQQAMWKKRYQDAYNAYQKSAYNKSQSGSSGYGLTGGTTTGDLNNTSDLEEMLKSLEFSNKPVTFDMDIGTSAGWSELSDLWTRKYNFTLPGTPDAPNGIELELGGLNEELKRGSDGNYYIYNKANGAYTKVEGAEGNNSKDEGESRWWKK